MHWTTWTIAWWTATSLMGYLDALARKAEGRKPYSEASGLLDSTAQIVIWIVGRIL